MLCQDNATVSWEDHLGKEEQERRIGWGIPQSPCRPHSLATQQVFQSKDGHWRSHVGQKWAGCHLPDNLLELLQENYDLALEPEPQQNSQPNVSHPHSSQWGSEPFLEGESEGYISMSAQVIWSHFCVWECVHTGMYSHSIIIYAHRKTSQRIHS